MPRDYSALCRKYPGVHRSINKVPSSTSIENFSNISNEPSTFTTALFAVCKCGDLIDLMDSFQLWSRQSLSIKLGLAPVSRKLATIIKAFFDTDTKILTRFVALRKNKATLCWPSSNCMLKSYSPVWTRCGIFVFALAPSSMFLFVSVATNVTIPFAYGPCSMSSSASRMRLLHRVEGQMERR